MLSVIRLNDSQADFGPAGVLKSEDYRQLRDAEQTILEARHSADMIMQQAREAYEEEKKRGFEEGLREARHKQVELMLANAAQIIHSYQEIEQTLTNLVIESVRKILNEFDKEELAYQVVRKALYHIGEGAQVTVKIATDVAAPVRAKIKEALEFYPGLEKFEVIADPNLGDGDCQIESNFGVIRANVDDQMEALTQAMNSRILESQTC
ncbi:HrpE/YscL family type III secretion apparatus protein [Hahella sp. CR1]|uniref:HrpE/YscL family type III secretion apparatus protein n=1 Tax=Hahella sp. CR1 TaxID=2992807 RepID=UPI0024430B0C|nr:HrpE/YscL family type III secretion apparatus protein [Hahella sp. CR1]MDG9668387.1 HrpE/YscL family type III secretion apparatus protein [Hahella sp. CR1]